jgi:jouberin
MVPEVYSLYKNGPRVKYPATLYVTVKSILAPKSFLPGIGSSYLASNQESADNKNSARDRDNTGDMSGNEMTTDEERTARDDKELKQKNVIWSRIAGLPCRIPNDVSLKLKTAKNGCYSVQFSATGSYISCACVGENNLFPIYVYDIPNGNYVMKFRGHFGLVYEMSWSKSDKYIVTASNDATAR